MKPLLLLILLTAALLATGGCKKGNEERRWGAYQEPVTPRALPRAAGVREMETLWRRNLGAGSEDGYAILQPAFGRDGVYAAGRNGAVYKLNPDSGATLWRRNLGAPIFSGVGVGGGVGDAGAGESLAVVTLDDSRVVALDANSGEVLWQSSLDRPLSAIPAVGNGRVVARTADGVVFGLDAADGGIVWSFERAVPGLSIHGDSPPLISGDAVFVGLANGKLLAHSVVTGREYWETEVSFARGRNELERLTDSDSTPLVAADTLYTATYQGNVAALQLADAAVKWKAAVSSRLPLALGGGRLLVTGEFGDIIALDAESGELLWTQDGFRGHGMSAPLALRERVLVGDARGNVFSLDLATGALLERRRVVNGAVVALVAGSEPGRFVALSSTGNLRALSLRAADDEDN